MGGSSVRTSSELSVKLINPSVEFLGAVPTDYASALKFIEVHNDY